MQITNHGQASLDLFDWVIYDKADEGPEFVFHSYVIGPGETIRVYTNSSYTNEQGETVEVDGYAEWGGFTFGRKTAIWHNTDPDLAALKNAGGEEVSSKNYPPGC